ncbi:MAG: hypothetical protein RLZ97_2081 [Verrucomicrobiota bacterium]|jgi:hypothetical protein
MDKLYWIACDDKDTTLFEGRYQGRTRGGALKFLKETIGRKSLNGLVFTITEIPVPLIREIVAEILAGGDGRHVTSASVSVSAEDQPPATTSDPEPFSQPETKSSRKGKKINLGHGDAFWSEVRAFYESCRSPKQTAEKFGISFNSVKTRANREGWRK